jgi:hemerythrin-like domain-containing protein
MNEDQSQTRRHFLAAAAAAGTGLVISSSSLLAAEPAERTPGQPKDEPEITPAEDLMSEHGVIERLLLIYDYTTPDLTAGRQAPIALIARAAELLRRFAENYHEKMEEEYVFPRFEKANRHVELVKVLRQQHDAGRSITGRVIQLCGNPTHPKFGDLPTLLRSYATMYYPHISRENSILFRDLRKVTPPREYAEMGERFEQVEQERLGGEGYEKTLAQVVEIEKSLRINDLAKFTPHV